MAHSKADRATELCRDGPVRLSSGAKRGLLAPSRWVVVPGGGVPSAQLGRMSIMHFVTSVGRGNS